MMGIEAPEEVIAMRTVEITEACDNDGDGEISKDEFITNALTCDFICDMLQVMEDDEEDGECEQEDEDENWAEEKVEEEVPSPKLDAKAKEVVIEGGSSPELDLNVVAALREKLGMHEADIREKHKDFLKKFPKGYMTKPEFVASCLEKEHVEEKAEALFSVFHASNGELVSFAEFMMASHATVIR